MKVVVPNMISGVGQVCLKYCKLLGVEPSSPSDDFTGQDVFMFCLPVEQHIEIMKKIKDYARTFKFMTVCETETVHPEYEKMFKISKKMYVPSHFCKRILERQFPQARLTVLKHWVPPPLQGVGQVQVPNPKPYIFYTIGNVLDPRKQVEKIVGVFLELGLPQSHLLIKATSSRDVDWKIPGVTIVNGILNDEDMQRIHNTGDCYVSFSNSEGVGMGAVEAAMNNKPVIMQEYGGCSEYVHTPYMIPCTLKNVGFQDFLFTPELVWGDPDVDVLKKHMKHAYENRITHMNHDHTREYIRDIQDHFTDC
jgi:glycosyltransferase involved in cell wall biosynthesis